MAEAEKNPFDALIDAFRVVVREEIRAAMGELNGQGADIHSKEWLKAGEAAQLYGLPTPSNAKAMANDREPLDMLLEADYKTIISHEGTGTKADTEAARLDAETDGGGPGNHAERPGYGGAGRDGNQRASRAPCAADRPWSGR
jgi:hypothetical protein